MTAEAHSTTAGDTAALVVSNPRWILVCAYVARETSDPQEDHRMAESVHASRMEHGTQIRTEQTMNLPLSEPYTTGNANLRFEASSGKFILEGGLRFDAEKVGKHHRSELSRIADHLNERLESDLRRNLDANFTVAPEGDHVVLALRLDGGAVCLKQLQVTVRRFERVLSRWRLAGEALVARMKQLPNVQEHSVRQA